jgi:hypothetical protein
MAFCTKAKQTMATTFSSIQLAQEVKDLTGHLRFNKNKLSDM